ncbi:MAG: glycogen synthase GlgA [Calditerrivibrio sp.]|nr:glycogen synthase GlgA [Calditerrivibrio sp.]
MDKYNILFIASEAVPFAKTGGLGDVVGVLPKYIRKFGHNVKVVIPRYYVIDIQKFKLEKLIPPLGVPMGIAGEWWCGVYRGFLPNSDVEIYFIDHEQFYGRKDLYNYEDGTGYIDNDNRFMFLSKAALQLSKMLGFKPDIIHINDWHTAMVPHMLKTFYKCDPHFENVKTVLTVHNMQYQGVFYKGVMDVLGSWEYFFDYEFKGQVNFLKGGLYLSDMVTTVSEGYAREIQTPAFGYGLEGVVRDISFKLVGILNGVDYDEWNPETDRLIPANYSEDDFSGKKICKARLQERFGLPVRDVPLFGIVSRLVHQKGIDILAEAIYRILSLDIQFVLLGNGDPWAHFFFGKIAYENPDKFGCYIGYENVLAHLVEAGADFFVMPSRFEPCGLNQMYSLRYGTPPLVHAVGGLNDTVENLDETTGEGTGFKFYELSANTLFDTIGWATYIYYNRQDILERMRRRGMKKRFTWEDAAAKYINVYNRAKGFF